jgi:predicted phage tail protein
VVGLFSAALSMVGLRTYLLINELTNGSAGLGGSKAEILADGLQAILFDAGTLFAFAGIVYLLAPGADEADEQQPASRSGIA